MYCHITDNLQEQHVDYPMELIWRTATNNNINNNTSDNANDEIFDAAAASMSHIPSSSASSRVYNNNNNYCWEPQFHRLHFPIDLPLKFYIQQWRGHDGGQQNNDDTTTLLNITNIYGTNITHTPLPPYLQLLQQQLLQSMSIFQSFCVLLWCLDEYWIYAIYTLCSLLLFECVQAYTRNKSVRRLREDAIGSSSSSGGGGVSDEYHKK